jgi:hypothetical protein
MIISLTKKTHKKNSNFFSFSFNAARLIFFFFFHFLLPIPASWASISWAALWTASTTLCRSPSTPMSTRARMLDLHLPHLQRRFRQAQQEPQLELLRHRRHRGHEDARRPIGRSLPLSPQGPSLRKRPRLQRHKRRGRRHER